MKKDRKERPLPKPPSTPFGRKKNFEQPEEAGSLTADRMAQAMAEGKIDEFLKEELPDNEYARNLANMMMGMTGMMPGPDMAASVPQAPAAEQSEPTAADIQKALSARDVPDDVRQAIMSGDVQGLMEKLRREHEKRNPGAGQQEEPTVPAAEAAPMQGMPAIDKEMIDALVRIAQENSVSLDWIILRAIKVYVQEYQKTGKL